MERSTSITNLAKALITFQLKVDKIEKDASNPFFKSKYATLTNILDAINTPLIEAGLVVSQFPVGVDSLTTLLIHAESGEYLCETYSMIGMKSNPQERGSFISYQRRYALASILNLNISDESDDDGNSATFGSIPMTKEVIEKQWLNKGTKEYIGAVEKMKAGKSSIEALKKYFKISKETESSLLNDCK
jgi:hypothetical protein